MVNNQPLAPLDANTRMIPQHDPFNPLSDKNGKPTPAFAHESQQEKILHSKLVKQER